MLSFTRELYWIELGFELTGDTFIDVWKEVRGTSPKGCRGLGHRDYQRGQFDGLVYAMRSRPRVTPARQESTAVDFCGAGWTRAWLIPFGAT